MNTKDIYDKFYQLLESNGELKITKELFTLLENYAHARLHDLVGIDIPIHFYFKEDILVEGDKINWYAPIRFNPITNEICKEKWSYNTNAFYSKKGVFVDFSISNLLHKRELYGYYRMYNIINYAFSLEHELQHVKQYNNLSQGAITYDNLKLSKNDLIIKCLSQKEDVRSKYFYANAHNDLFLEIDANTQAKKYVSEQISKRSLGNIRADDKYNINDILKRRIEEAFSGRRTATYTIDMVFGPNDSNKKVDLDVPPEKIIDLLTDSLVRQDPAIYLHNYPVLKSIYNLDGTKKTYHEMNEEIQKKPYLKYYYDRVIEEDAFLKIQKIEDNMINDYVNAKTNQEKSNILDKGLERLKKIINSEVIDLDNVLVYLDKRITELDQKDDNNKLIFYLTKQALLESNMIKDAYIKSEKYKEEIMESEKILKEKCHISLENKDRFTIQADLYKLLLMLEHNDTTQDDLYKLFLKLEHNDTTKVFTNKGYSKEEINEMIEACKKYRNYLNKNGYLLVSDEKLVSEKSRSVLEGYNNLYETNYYKNVVSNCPDLDKRVQLKNEFEIINQMYLETQKRLKISSRDLSNSVLDFESNNPIIERLLKDNPNILNTLYQIRDMEERTKHLTRLDALIIQCESYLRKEDNKYR